MKRLGWALASLGFLLAVLAAWKLASDARLINPLWFPPPERAAVALAGWIASGELWHPLGQTVWRMFAGWLAATVIGVTVGAAIAASRLARDLFEPTAEFLRPLPASAVLPPAVLLLGLSDAMIVFVVAFGSVWPILLGAIHGFKSLDPRLAEVARMLRFSPWQRALKFQLPNALPDIFAGMRVSIAIALIITVASEMLSSQPGVGHLMLVAARAFRSAEIFAGIAVLGVLGFLTNAAMQKLEARLLRWRPAAAL
ncbi:MAG TPA: ABC transporter permease [Burkholderiales bacterium]|nr:ABC transporter permease [Burkholderiales bacterium]